jgi:hypothetical protein
MAEGTEQKRRGAAPRSAVEKVVSDPVSRRKFVALTGGSVQNGEDPAPGAVDAPLPEAQVLKADEPFIA